MKKLIFSFVILFAAMTASINAQTADYEFIGIYNQAIELNRETYPDFRKIPINAPVAFPDYDQEGVIYFPARVPENGKNDCIWYLSLKYLNLKAEYEANRKEAMEKDSITSTPIEETEAADKDSADLDFWALIIFIGLCLSVIALYLLLRYRPWNNRRNLDRNPVILGGLGSNPAEAAAQISALTGSRIVKSEKGRLICASPVKVQMNFSDGVKKVPLVSGEEYYRITEHNGTVRYARRACGNLINGSIAQLPAGVTFVLSTEENATWEIEKKETKETIEQKEEKPADTENEENIHLIHLHLSAENEIAAILSEAGMMMNAPSKITYKDLVVEFFPPVEKKEKAEDK